MTNRLRILGTRVAMWNSYEYYIRIIRWIGFGPCAAQFVAHKFNKASFSGETLVALIQALEPFALPRFKCWSQVVGRPTQPKQLPSRQLTICH